MRFKNIIDILFTIFVLSVVITDGVIIYIATKPSQFSSCYNTLFFSCLTLFIVSLRYVVFEKSNAWIIFTGVFFGAGLSLFSIYLCISYFPRWDMWYAETFKKLGIISATLDTLAFFWGWLVTPLILLWIKFVFISSPDSTSSKKER